MAPFLRLGASRFSPGTYGVLYTADALRVAIRESAYHAGRLLAASHVAAPAAVPRYAVELTLGIARHADLRRGATDDVRDEHIYDPDDYRAAQRVGVRLREAGREGVRYDSVRAPGGICNGTFRPAAVENVAPSVRELELVWDGTRIAEYRELTTHRLDE